MIARIVERVSGGVAEWRAATLTPLSEPLFRALWLATIASNFGAVVQMVGASWLMTEMSGSPGMIALVQTSALLPMLLLALPAGALADNMDRRSLMLFSQALGLASAAALALSAYLGWINPGLLLAFTVLIGCAQALHQPAWQTSIVDLTPRPMLPAAIGLNSLAFNAARSMGPALGGVVIAAQGPAFTFVLNAVSFLGLIAVLARSRIPRPKRDLPPEPVGAAMVAGLRYVARAPVLKTVLLHSAMFGFAASALWSLMPLVAQQRLGGGPLFYGLLLAAFGAGSLTGALFLASLRARFGPRRLMTGAALGYAATSAVAAASGFLPLTLAALAICGASWILAFATAGASIQMSSPRWVAGRAVAMGQASVTGFLAIGSAAWGVTAEHVGVVQSIALASVFLAAVAALGSRFAPFPNESREDLSPRGPMEIVPPRVHLDNRSGPIIVTFLYRVPPSEAERFLADMHLLGQARRRNGARAWHIAQDVDEPDLWIETIESATWLDVLRRVERGTVADQIIAGRVQNYRLPEPAGVRRMIERPPGSRPLDT